MKYSLVILYLSLCSVIQAQDKPLGDYLHQIAIDSFLQADPIETERKIRIESNTEVMQYRPALQKQNRPLLIVNKRIAHFRELRHYSEIDAKWINIIHPGIATNALYGLAGKNGVIVVQLKRRASKRFASRISSGESPITMTQKLFKVALADMGN